MRRHLKSLAWVVYLAVWLVSVSPLICQLADVAVAKDLTADFHAANSIECDEVHDPLVTVVDVVVIGHGDDLKPCCYAGMAAIAPAVIDPAMMADDPTRDPPELFLRAPRTLFAWAPSQARAPPLRA